MNTVMFKVLRGFYVPASGGFSDDFQAHSGGGDTRKVRKGDLLDPRDLSRQRQKALLDCGAIEVDGGTASALDGIPSFDEGDAPKKLTKAQQKAQAKAEAEAAKVDTSKA